jgi:hypothetical protein
VHAGKRSGEEERRGAHAVQDKKRRSGAEMVDSLFPAKYSRAREDIPSFATSHEEYAVNYSSVVPQKMGLGPNRTVTLLSAQLINGLGVEFSGTAWGHVHRSEKPTTCQLSTLVSSW